MFQETRDVIAVEMTLPHTPVPESSRQANVRTREVVALAQQCELEGAQVAISVHVVVVAGGAQHRRVLDDVPHADVC